MIQGADLRPGDRVYTSPFTAAYTLVRRLTATSWQVERHSHPQPVIATVRIDRLAQYAVTNRPQPAGLRWLEVSVLDLAAGDVVPHGTIEWIGALHIDYDPIYRRRRTARKGLLRHPDGRLIPYLWTDVSVCRQRIVGGPKLDAARVNPTHVQHTPGGSWVWVGGAA
jgi:hypothetical protein